MENVFWEVFDNTKELSPKPFNLLHLKKFVAYNNQLHQIQNSKTTHQYQVFYYVKKIIVFIVFSHLGNEIQTTVPIETPVKGRNLFFRRKEVEHTWGERWRNRRGKWRRSWVCREWKWRDRPARNRTSHAFQRYQKNSGFFSGN